jgi:hypothetical protein
VTLCSRVDVGLIAVAASCKVPRAGSLFKRLLRGARLRLHITDL